MRPDANKRPRYVVITPVKNEAAHIEKTIRSVVSQTMRPVAWAIVNDGSTDATPQIIRRKSLEHPWIRAIDLPGTTRVRGGHIVRLFYEGLRALSKVEFDYVVKLDGDVSFDRSFFEKALSHMGSNPALGITSGVSHIIKRGRLVEERSSKGHTLGAAKIYRAECLSAIGGLVPEMGWDGIDEIMARMKGWEARPITGLVVIHHRPEGHAKGAFTSGLERGRGSYFMGYHPLFIVARSIRRMFSKPPVLDGAGMLAGYAVAWLRGHRRVPDAEFVRRLRAEQIRRLLLFKPDF